MQRLEAVLQTQRLVSWPWVVPPSMGRITAQQGGVPGSVQTEHECMALHSRVIPFSTPGRTALLSTSSAKTLLQPSTTTFVSGQGRASEKPCVSRYTCSSSAMTGGMYS